MTADRGSLQDHRECIRVLRDALAEAIEGLREMRPYVSDYFAQKWDHDAYAVHARQALTDSHADELLEEK